MINYNKFLIKNCWINLYKPKGISSSTCTFRVRKLLTEAFKKSGVLRLNEKLKCGHLGTLDPMAEGILPIACGEASKTIFLQENRKKSYTFTICWGQQTDSDDAFGNVINTCTLIPTDNEINYTIKDFIGEIEQTPNRFSAIHINGVRAYKLARMGKTFKVPSRKITIYNLKLIKSWKDNKNYSEFNVVCSTGTYIRTLASDIASKLGTCGHLVKLIRINNSMFNLSNSVDYQNFLDFFNCFLHTNNREGLDSFTFKGVRVLDFFKPIDYGLDDIPVILVTEKFFFDKFINGCVSKISGYFDGLYRVYIDNRTPMNNYFIGIAEVKNGKIYPKKVFNLFKKDK